MSSQLTVHTAARRPSGVCVWCVQRIAPRELCSAVHHTPPHLGGLFAGIPLYFASGVGQWPLARHRHSEAPDHRSYSLHRTHHLLTRSRQGPPNTPLQMVPLRAVAVDPDAPYSQAPDPHHEGAIEAPASPMRVWPVCDGRLTRKCMKGALIQVISLHV